MTDKTLVTFNLPQMEDEEANQNFRRHTLVLTAKIVDAINEYTESIADLPSDEQMSAFCIGAACYVASHVVAVGFDDDHRKQVAEGLLATMSANSPSNATPPSNKSYVN